MKVTKTNLQGVLVLKPTVYKDSRGYFTETYGSKHGGVLGPHSWMQDNESKSSIFTLRGLHYQTGFHAQAKLVRVVVGAVLDVVVDIRPTSKTYGEHFSILLTGKDNKQLYIPRGFAHGFSVLEDETIFNYKCDNYYSSWAEAGINPFDPDLNINWMVQEDEAIVSEKDKNWPNLCDIQK